MSSCHVRNFSLFAFIFSLALSARASWYWPFGTNDAETAQVRLSELMEPATTNIDAAADYAAEGKFKEAQDSYRAAIAALDKLEHENPERAVTPEFATVRTKRAYVNAALDSMLLAEARENAKAVAVTDTTELEVKLALKPWKEFLQTYDALTNDYRIVMNRVAYLETSDEAHKLLNAVADEKLQVACVSNFTAMVAEKPALNAKWDDLTAAYDAAADAVGKLRRFSKSTGRRGGVQVFDVCRQDVRKCVAACTDAWPKVGEALAEMNRHAEGLHGVLLEVGAQRDFAFIAESYATKVKGRTREDAESMASDMGYLHACTAMLGELDAAGAGVVHRGVLYRLSAVWGGDDPEVPTKEDDKGLVKDDGDKRPEVTSQIDDYMAKERKHADKVKKVAERQRVEKATKSAVREEVEKLLKEDPKSRRARMLLAGEDLRSGNAAEAAEMVDALLAEKPNDGPALNMRAAIEASTNDLRRAENTLDQAIRSNPRDYHAYYNMATVQLRKGNVDSARRYYETGRSFAGPKNPAIEKMLKK